MRKSKKYLGEVEWEQLKENLRKGKVYEKLFIDLWDKHFGDFDFLRLIDFRRKKKPYDFGLGILKDEEDVEILMKIDIKSQQTPFKRAKKYVDVKPENCFVIAVYKIVRGWREQRREGLPYIIVACPIWREQLFFISYTKALRILKEKLPFRFQYWGRSQENMHYDINTEFLPLDLLFSKLKLLFDRMKTATTSVDIARLLFTLEFLQQRKNSELNVKFV